MLRAGAHAAWAVPAIQIAVATPAFAASVDARLTAVVTETQQSGTTLTIKVQVTSTGSAANGVGLSVSGDITGTPAVTQTSGSTTLAVNGIATYTVTAKVKGTTTGPNSGAVILTPSGTTANSTTAAVATPATTYAQAQLSVTTLGYTRVVGDPGDYVVVKLSTAVVAAKSAVVRLRGFNADGSTASSDTVSVPLGGNVTLTIPVAFSTGAHTVVAAATGTSDNNGGGAALPADATLAVSKTNPYSNVQVAALSIPSDRVSVSRSSTYNVRTRTTTYASTATVSFRIVSDRAAKSIRYTITSADGSWTTSGQAGSTSNHNGTQYVTVSNVPVNAARGTFKITATGVTNDATAYPALPATYTGTI